MSRVDRILIVVMTNNNVVLSTTDSIEDKRHWMDKKQWHAINYLLIEHKSQKPQL
jgi:hypothetical protein